MLCSQTPLSWPAISPTLTSSTHTPSSHRKGSGHVYQAPLRPPKPIRDCGTSAMGDARRGSFPPSSGKAMGPSSRSRWAPAHRPDSKLPPSTNPAFSLQWRNISTSSCRIAPPLHWTRKREALSLIKKILGDQARGKKKTSLIYTGTKSTVAQFGGTGRRKPMLHIH